MTFNFEDELKEIFQRQKINNPETGEPEPFLPPEVMANVLGSLKNPKTYGYFVYLAPGSTETELVQGLVPLGEYDPAKLSHSHRAANALIDHIVFCEGEDD